MPSPRWERAEERRQTALLAGESERADGAMIQSLFIMASTGEVIIEKHWRGVTARGLKVHGETGEELSLGGR